MKNLFLFLVFGTIGKFLFATDCGVQLSFAGKNNTWKTINYTIANGVIYVNVDTEMDSISFQVLKNSGCSNTYEINSYSYNEELVSINKKSGEIKTSSSGLHKILIIGPNNSEWYKIFVRVIKPTSLSNLLNYNSLSIYPNPATTNFFVENAAQVETVKIHDITGAIVMLIENNLRKEMLDIDISKLPGGQYFITFHNDKIKVTKKIIKL